MGKLTIGCFSFAWGCVTRLGLSHTSSCPTPNYHLGTTGSQTFTRVVSAPSCKNICFGPLGGPGVHIGTTCAAGGGSTSIYQTGLHTPHFPSSSYCCLATHSNGLLRSTTHRYPPRSCCYAAAVTLFISMQSPQL